MQDVSVSYSPHPLPLVTHPLRLVTHPSPLSLTPSLLLPSFLLTIGALLIFSLDRSLKERKRLLGRLRMGPSVI